MGLRYRRYIRILPGVRMNVSKSGLSWTFGPRGASINVGRRGTYMNVGVPGTGIFDREKLSGPHEQPEHAEPAPEPAETAEGEPVVGHVEVHVATVVILFALVFLAGMIAEALVR